MYSFHATVFVKICDQLTIIEQRLEMHMEKASGPVKLMKQTSFPEEDLQRLRTIPALMENIELPISKSHAEELVKYLDGEEVLDGYELACLAKALRWTFIYELQNRLVFMVPSDRARHYDTEGTILGEEVTEEWPDLFDDADEAGKCFATGRYTASVFHLMRIMEFGLYQLGKSLNIAISKNWQQAITDIEKEIKFWNAYPSPGWKTIEPLYAESATHYRWVKDAWRNHTMHIRKIYGLEKAKLILDNVSDFMRDLLQVLVLK